MERSRKSQGVWGTASPKFNKASFRLVCADIGRSHQLAMVAAVLVRQLRGPHFSTCPWGRRRSRLAGGAPPTPRRLPPAPARRLGGNQARRGPERGVWSSHKGPVAGGG